MSGALWVAGVERDVHVPGTGAVWIVTRSYVADDDTTDPMTTDPTHARLFPTKADAMRAAGRAWGSAPPAARPIVRRAG